MLKVANQVLQPTCSWKKFPTAEIFYIKPKKNWHWKGKESTEYSTQYGTAQSTTVTIGLL